jgi:hypothetical protein
MELPKRKQIVRYAQPLTEYEKTRELVPCEYVVRVLKVARRACRVVCLARRLDRPWSWDKKVDEEWWFNPRKGTPPTKWELIPYTDLPKYLNWELGTAFEKVLKGEKL